MAYERYYYMPMSVNADGDGPADERETARVLHEVWDDACLTLCTCSDEETARHVASLLNAHPVTTPQQPANNPSAANPADAFRNMFAILHNLETSDLPFMSAEQRLAFFRDPVPAILRLDDARLDALYALVQSKQPARYRH